MNNEFELPEIFDPSQYAGTTDLVPIPPGWQSAHIVEASYKEVLNNSTSTYMLAVFEVTEGAHKGRKIFQNVTLTNQNQHAVEIGQRLLTDICNALKIGPLKNLEVLLYKPMKVRIGIKRDRDGVYPDRKTLTLDKLEIDVGSLARFENKASAAALGGIKSPDVKALGLVVTYGG